MNQPTPEQIKFLTQRVEDLVKMGGHRGPLDLTSWATHTLAALNDLTPRPADNWVYLVTATPEQSDAFLMSTLSQDVKVEVIQEGGAL